MAATESDMVRQIFLIFCLSPMVMSAEASAFEIDMFGHQVSVLQADDKEKLVIGGREILKDQYVSIDQLEVVGGTPVAIGTTSAGGNACEGAPFIISFPPNANPRIDGPLETCFVVRIEKSADMLTFSTAATPNEPSKKWTWTVADGLKVAQGEKFVADTSKGWTQLRERTVSHPSELLDYAEIGSEIARMAGPDRELVNDILMGVGSGQFKGDYFIGMTCSRHMCGDQEGLLIANIPSKKIYLAWRPSGQKIKVNPAVTAWPEKAKAEIREWAAKWK